MTTFADRAEAGRLLAEKLTTHRGDDTIVAGIPGGGVVVGAPIAEALGAPLHLVQVDPVARASRRRASTARMRGQISAARSMFDSSSTATEGARRSGSALFGADLPDVQGKTVIIVDDGLHDDLEIHRTLMAFRGHRAAKLILAVPFMVSSTADLHSSEVDEVLVLERLEELADARAMYADPTSPTLEEVRALLTHAPEAIAEEDGPDLYQNILVPVDFSDPSVRAVREALRIQRSGGALITLFYVRTDAGHYDSAAVAEDEINAQQPLIDFAEPLIPEGANVALKVGGGDAADEIIQEILNGSYDLVVMGTHGRRGLRRAVFGSVAEHVLRDSMTPVLITR